MQRTEWLCYQSALTIEVFAASSSFQSLLSVLIAFITKLWWLE